MARQHLLIFLASLAVVGTLVYFVWLCARDLFRYVIDWLDSRQFDNMREFRLEREQARREENERRLANGCEHEFDTQFGALPPDVCCKCGLARIKPLGDCDHVWRRDPGLIPSSTCGTCGERYGGALAEQKTANF